MQNLNQPEEQLEPQQKDVNHDTILAMIADDQAPIAIASLYHLSDMPADIFDRFTTMWPGVDTIRRGQIARHLADISEENYQVDFTPLTYLFLADDNEAVRIALFDILWDSTKMNLVPAIIRTMENDSSTAVRAAATATLGHYVLMMEWGQIPRTAEEKINNALLKQLRDDFAPLAMKRAALESIASIGTEEVHAYIDQAYSDADKTLKLSAVFAMGRTADPRWMPHIMNELDSEEPDMRSEAARAAASLGKSEAAEALAEIAKYDDDIEARIAAVHALGQIGNDIASQTLQELSEESEEIGIDELAQAIDDALEELDIFNFDDIDLSLLNYSDEDDNDADYLDA